LKTDHLRNTILEINRKISKNKIFRPDTKQTAQEFPFIVDFIASYAKSESKIVKDINIKHEYYPYFNPEHINLDVEKLIHKKSDHISETFPAFDNYTNNLALLMFYEYLVSRYEYFEFGKENRNTKISLESFYNDNQLSKLYDLLNEKSLIKNTDKEHFIGAFGGGTIKYNSFTINWVADHTLLAYLIDQICHKNSNRWANGSKIFNIKNIAQLKNQYLKSISQLPREYKRIDDILKIVNP